MLSKWMAARVPSERTRWQDDVLQILDEDGSVLISLPLSSSGSMAQGAIENPPKRERQKQMPKKAAPGFLGIQMAPIDELPAKNADGRPWDLDASRCTMIAAVVPNSPAASAGLRAGDIIIPQTKRSADPQTLSSTIAGMQPGTVVSAIIIRDGQKMKVEIELGARPADAPAPAHDQPSAAEAQLQNLDGEPSAASSKPHEAIRTRTTNTIPARSPASDGECIFRTRSHAVGAGHESTHVPVRIRAGTALQTT